MGLYKFKDFLTLTDVADYLTEKGFLKEPVDEIKLWDFIFSLVDENKIKPVFKYVGKADIETSIKNSDDNYYGLTEIHQNIPISYHLLLDDKIFMEMRQAITYPFELKGNKAFHWTDRELKFGEKMERYEIKDLFSITFYDVVYPRIDFDEFFNQSSKNLSNDYPANTALQSENDHLKAENERLTAELALLAGKVQEQQGDSLLILGAVMDCLDNETIRNYTQSVLVDKIIERYPNVIGISESTIKKKFAESKKHLKKHN